MPTKYKYGEDGSYFDPETKRTYYKDPQYQKAYDDEWNRLEKLYRARQEEQRKIEMANFQRVLAQADALTKSMQALGYRTPLPWEQKNRFDDGGDSKNEKGYYEYMEKVAKNNAAKWEMSEDEALLHILNDPTYNYKAYYEANKANPNFDSDDHWPDTYKTAYHPTFSDESIYSGKRSQYNPNGEVGGSWLGNSDILYSSYMWNPEVAHYIEQGKEQDISTLENPHFQYNNSENVSDNTETSNTLNITAGYSTSGMPQIDGIGSYLLQNFGTPLPSATGQQGVELGKHLDATMKSITQDPYGPWGSPDYNYTPPGKLHDFWDYAKWAFKSAKGLDKLNPYIYTDFLTFPNAAEDILHKQLCPQIPLTWGNTSYNRGSKMYAHALAQEKLDAIKDIAHGNMTYEQFSKKFEGVNIGQVQDAVRRYKDWEKLPDDNKTPFNFTVTGRDYNRNYGRWDWGGDHHNYGERILTPLGLETTLGSFNVSAYPDSTVVSDYYDSAVGIDPNTGKPREVPIQVELADAQGKKNIDKLFGDASFKDLLYPLGWLTTEWILRYPQVKWGSYDYDPDSTKPKTHMNLRPLKNETLDKRKQSK